MTTLRARIVEARRKYRKSRKKLSLPIMEHVGMPGYARLSAMGGCKLQHAYEKLGVEPDFPELTPDVDENKDWLMDHGNYVAPMVQEPLMYLAMTEEGVAFQPEETIIDHNLKVIGRVDGILSLNGSQRVIEIKDAEGVEKRSVGEPKLSYCLQALAYCLVTGITSASIIIVSKWGFHVYNLEHLGAGRFELQYEDGTAYTPPVWMDNFNHPDTLSFDRVRQEIAGLREYLTDVDLEQNSEEVTEGIEPPIEDPLNDKEKGWLCCRHSGKLKATDKKNGLMFVGCPFAKRCHGWTQLKYETEKRSDGSFAIVTEF